MSRRARGRERFGVNTDAPPKPGGGPAPVPSPARAATQEDTAGDGSSKLDVTQPAHDEDAEARRRYSSSPGDWPGPDDLDVDEPTDAAELVNAGHDVTVHPDGTGTVGIGEETDAVRSTKRKKRKGR